MIGDIHLPHMVMDKHGKRLTLLDCAIGNHTGHFTIHIVRQSDGSRTTACDEHLAEARL